MYLHKNICYCNIQIVEDEHENAVIHQKWHAVNAAANTFNTVQRR